MYNNRRRGNFHRDNRDENRHENYSAKRQSKGMILLKSSVFMMLIVLVTLAAAFVIIKNKRTPSDAERSACKKNQAIKIRENIDDIENGENAIFILTEVDKNGKQELLKIDSKCGGAVFRILFQKTE